jgi:mono/diheme cytochrome c family protein
MARLLPIVMATVLSIALSQAIRNPPTPKPAAGAQVEAAGGDVARGDYIVHSVAMCVQCHSPRDRNGDLLMDQQFEGARMPVTSPFPGKPFAFSTPRLAGLPAGWKEDELAHFLETGDTGDRQQPQAPMPPFRMSAEDARSVVAYLKSLRK